MQTEISRYQHEVNLLFVKSLSVKKLQKQTKQKKAEWVNASVLVQRGTR